jgi:glycosyltransferase involved in cell wall biosynthesis
LLARKVRGVHSVSTYVQRTVERDFLEPEGLSVAQTIIPSFREDEPEERAQRREPAGSVPLEPYLAQLPEEPFILFVGALRVVKGMGHLLAAYRRLEAPPPLALIGTVEADTPRDLPPGVHLLQDFPHPAVLAAWDRCLFGVLPSLWPEPLGSVVYEGMSRGKAVIGTRPGGHTDLIVDGVTGLLIPQGDTDALENTMRALIGSGELRERLGLAARERARQFTARVAVPRFEQIYRRLASGQASETNERVALPLGRR